MPTDRELMQQALDALEWCYDVTEWPANGESAQDKAIEALRARLAQPEQDETPYLIGARLFREGKGISFIPTAVPSDADIGEALQGWEDAKTAEEIAQPEQAPTNNGRYLTGYKAQPEQEPVAWMHPTIRDCVSTQSYSYKDAIPLYTAPPQREWQWLTDEEVAQAWAKSKGDVLYRLKPFAQAIEAKLKEKNA